MKKYRSVRTLWGVSVRCHSSRGRAMGEGMMCESGRVVECVCKRVPWREFLAQWRGWTPRKSTAERPAIQ